MPHYLVRTKIGDTPASVIRLATCASNRRARSTQALQLQCLGPLFANVPVNGTTGRWGFAKTYSEKSELTVSTKEATQLCIDGHRYVRMPARVLDCLNSNRPGHKTTSAHLSASASRPERSPVSSISTTRARSHFWATESSFVLPQKSRYEAAAALYAPPTFLLMERERVINRFLSAILVVLAPVSFVDRNRTEHRLTHHGR